MSWLLGIIGFIFAADGFDREWSGQSQAQVIFGGVMLLAGVVLYALGDD